MSHAYRAVGWNRQKRIYDAVVAGGVLLYLGVLVGAGALLRPNATAETLLIRALGTGAFLMLHLVLSIGPLCRLSPRFLPLLYNRRHLGVATFALGLAHGGFALFQFHALGTVSPLVSVLTGDGSYLGPGPFPFQPLGLAALGVLFLMAATSHDFWLAQLTPPVWKALHMGVYLADGLLVAHVALGVLQPERHPALAALLVAGVAWVVGLHLIAGWRERSADRPCPGAARDDGFVEACRTDELLTDRGHVVTLAGERVAIFLVDGAVTALSNVCQHQNGPLGEGCVIDGLVTCPWHGFQYDPANGSSPPPFTERVPTFRVRVAGDRVLVDPRPNPPGTPTAPAPLAAEEE